MTVAELADRLQEIAHQGYALYNIEVLNKEIEGVEYCTEDNVFQIKLVDKKEKK